MGNYFFGQVINNQLTHLDFGRKYFRPIQPENWDSSIRVRVLCVCVCVFILWTVWANIDGFLLTKRKGFSFTLFNFILNASGRWRMWMHVCVCVSKCSICVAAVSCYTFSSQYCQWTHTHSHTHTHLAGFHKFTNKRVDREVHIHKCSFLAIV